MTYIPIYNIHSRPVLIEIPEREREHTDRTMLPEEAATAFECPQGFEEVEEDVIVDDDVMQVEEMRLPEDDSSDVKVLVVIPDNNNGDQNQRLLTLEIPSNGDQIQQVCEWVCILFSFVVYA